MILFPAQPNVLANPYVPLVFAVNPALSGGGGGGGGTATMIRLEDGTILKLESGTAGLKLEA